MITIYTLPICPNCDELKSIFNANNIDYMSKDLDDDDIKMELLMNSVTLVDAPIVEINGQFYDKDSALKEMGLW